MKSTIRIVFFAAAMCALGAIGWSHPTPAPDQNSAPSRLIRRKRPTRRERKLAPARKWERVERTSEKALARAPETWPKGRQGPLGAWRMEMLGAPESLWARVPAAWVKTLPLAPARVWVRSVRVLAVRSRSSAARSQRGTTERLKTDTLNS